MKRLGLRAAAVLAAAALLCTGRAAAAPSVSARSAILMDAATGRVLFAQEADRQSLIASITKVMTGLLICEDGDLGRTVTVPPEAVGVEGSSLYLKLGEQLTVEQLLYGLMLRSGNDAAVALAVTADGTAERFVARMNRRAAELGLADTHFANPHGLDDEGNYSTARDLARLAAAAMENETFRQVVSTRTYAFGQRSLTNHNKLLWRCNGVVGVKTGYTRAAGRLLVSAAERMGRRLIAVTINDPDDWADHAALLDWGFSRMQEKEAAPAGQSLGAVPVVGGTAAVVRCRLTAALRCTLLPEEGAEVRLCLPRVVWAPVTEGAQAGWAELCVDGAVLARAPLVWETGAGVLQEPPGLLERLLGG